MPWNIWKLTLLSIFIYAVPSEQNDEVKGTGKNKVVTLKDLERLGARKLTKTVADYYQSGADHEQTLKENVEAFSRWRLPFHVLVNVVNRTLNTTIPGKDVGMPVGISPSAMQKMAHEDGEIGTAKASQAARTVMILSTLSSISIEDIRKNASRAMLWLQLYVFKNRTITKELIRRAEQAKFDAIVLTVDAPVWGQRIVDVRNAFTTPEGIKLANFAGTDYQVFGKGVQGSGLTKYTNDFFDPALTWKDVTWLKNHTKLPVVLKGIVNPEDASLAVRYGASAIIVSNHGGRQLDGSPATIEALTEVVQAVNGSLEVYLDGGVRTGTDIVKALALGAKAVFVGRPALWGLAYNGYRGVTRMLEILRTELNRTLALMGRNSVAELKPEDVVREEHYGRLLER
uniref:(S)-2-hydroxy-acid oxidase n=1 Tax=Amblyomma maculatum TaxID=34609 RepID=G3MP55_AMBMU